MTAPTPPPVVACDQTQPAALVPPLPPRSTPPGRMLHAMDAWAVQVMGILQAEVTTRNREHDCMESLRKKGVIR